MSALSTLLSCHHRRGRICWRNGADTEAGDTNYLEAMKHMVYQNWMVPPCREHNIEKIGGLHCMRARKRETDRENFEDRRARKQSIVFGFLFFFLRLVNIQAK